MTRTLPVASDLILTHSGHEDVLIWMSPCLGNKDTPEPAYPRKVNWKVRTMMALLLQASHTFATRPASGIYSDWFKVFRGAPVLKYGPGYELCTLVKCFVRNHAIVAIAVNHKELYS